MTIASIDEGEEFIVDNVCLCRETGKRLADMGFTKGARGRIVRRGFLGGPLQIRLGDCDIMIRASEASGVTIEQVIGAGRGMGRGHGGMGNGGRWGHGGRRANGR